MLYISLKLFKRRLYLPRTPHAFVSTFKFGQIIDLSGKYSNKHYFREANPDFTKSFVLGPCAGTFIFTGQLNNYSLPTSECPGAVLSTLTERSVGTLNRLKRMCNIEFIKWQDIKKK